MMKELLKEEIELIEEIANAYDKYMQQEMENTRQMYRWDQVYGIFGDAGEKWEQSKPIYNVRNEILEKMQERREEARRLVIKLCRP